MSSAFDVLADAFATVLGQSPAVSSNIEQDDVLPLPAADTTGITIVLGASQPEQLGGILGNPVDWITEVAVHCMASALATTARPAAHTLAGAAYARLAADPSLGIADAAGVHIGEPEVRRQFDRTERRFALVTLVYSVRHRTTSLTLE